MQCGQRVGLPDTAVEVVVVLDDEEEYAAGADGDNDDDVRGTESASDCRGTFHIRIGGSFSRMSGSAEVSLETVPMREPGRDPGR